MWVSWCGGGFRFVWWWVVVGGTVVLYEFFVMLVFGGFGGVGVV